MQLSQAIRLGSMCCRQSFGAYYESAGGTVVAACALGAALLAVNKTEIIEESEWNKWDDAFAPQYRRRTVCPGGGCGPKVSSAYGLAIHLNDDHYWSRERIAAWVETLEEGYAADKTATHRPVQAKIPNTGNPTSGTASS